MVPIWIFFSRSLVFVQLRLICFTSFWTFPFCLVHSIDDMNWIFDSIWCNVIWSAMFPRCFCFNDPVNSCLNWISEERDKKNSFFQHRINVNVINQQFNTLPFQINQLYRRRIKHAAQNSGRFSDAILHIVLRPMFFEYRFHFFKLRATEREIIKIKLQ